MHVSLNLDSTYRGGPKPRSRSSCGCDLHCQEELFGHLADRSQLSIMQTLCEGAKTDVPIATATGLSQSDISFSLDRGIAAAERAAKGRKGSRRDVFKSLQSGARA